MCSARSLVMNVDSKFTLCLPDFRENELEVQSISKRWTLYAREPNHNKTVI